MEVLEETIGLFHKYNSIENSYREEFVNKIKEHGYGDKMYCITEKIHGSNTQICYSKTQNKWEYGKRTCAIEPGESCYNVQPIFDSIREKVEGVWDILAKDYANLEEIILYGEIFGGCYPHEEVQKDNHASKVQKGVYYSPSNQWKSFDIAYKLSDEDRFHYLSGVKFFAVCADVGIDTVPLLDVTRNLNDALAYPNDKHSVVYKSYNLPELEDNIMEGVVIRPWNDDLWVGQSRVVLKNKNERFKEKSHEKKTNIQVEVPEAVKAACEEISVYVTENRVNNVISHLGEVTLADIGKVIGLTAKDVLEDFKKESGTLNVLEKTEEKMVTKYMQSEVAKIVRKVMLR